MELVKRYLIILLVCTVGLAQVLKAEPMSVVVEESENADSIIKHVINSSPHYAHMVDEYYANLYVKGRVKVHRRNLLIKLVPSMFRFEKGVKDYLVESMNEVHYTAPDIYDLKVKALTGTMRRNSGEIGNVMEYFNMNPYCASLLPGQLLSPLNESGMKRYYYLLDTIMGRTDSLQYKVLIVPRYKSHQLISGYMVVNHGTWTIDEMAFSGKVEQVTFRAKVKMGHAGNELYLPKRFEMNMLFRFLGNKVEADYEAEFDYQSIFLSEVKRESSWKKNKYDLSESFRLSSESVLSISDTAYMKSIRPYPLKEQEERLYRDYRFRSDSLRLNKREKSKARVFWGDVGDALISRYTINLDGYGSFRGSPLIDPLALGYSHTYGYTYVQKFRYNLLFSNQQLLRIYPRIGYNFTHKEFYWRADLNYYYWPQRLGQIRMRVGTGNRIYSSDVLDDIKNQPDTARLDFDKLNLNYFKDNYLILTHDVELMNGLSLELGFSYHKRTMVNPVNPDVFRLEMLNKLRRKYVTFAPRVRVEWTPGQYFYMSGKRKINLHSYYPTFSLAWERGIKGVLHSTGCYERLELDMQQSVELGGLSGLFYRVGCGAFTDQNDVYFVDFENFSHNNLPMGWNDDIGGAFQLLDRRWYNSSSKYLRGHITYEAPFLMFYRLRKHTSIIQNERLYGSVLLVPRLLPYLELGYGIGTHIFDLGMFVSSVKGKFDSFGCKFTFELFRR